MIVKEEVWQKAKQITSNFEGWLSGNFDGQYLSYGFLQWNFGQGTLQPLFKRLFNKLADIPCLPDASLRNAIANGNEKQWALSIQRNNIVVDPWLTALRSLYNLPEWQKIMDDASLEYRNQAIALCDKYKVYTDRAFCLMFDIAVQCWSIRNQPKSNNLKDIVDALLLQIGQWKNDVQQRKMAIVNNCDMGRGWNASIVFNDQSAFEDIDLKEVLHMLFNDEQMIPIWGKTSVERLTHMGLIKGDENGNFNPNAPITRTEIVVVLDKLLQLLGK